MLQGTVDPIPAGFSTRSLLVAGQGVNDTMYAWGDALLLLGGKTRPGPDVDIVVSQLSYWTDNGALSPNPRSSLQLQLRRLKISGAYYYYNTESDTTYEQTMLDARDYEISQVGPSKRAAGCTLTF